MALALSLLLVLLARSTADAAQFPSKYDKEIEQSVKRWWPDYPFWLAWKAQLYQESRLNPAAVSPVGARGLAQFMPGTWSDVSSNLGLIGSPHDEAAIEAGAYYMAKLRRVWKVNRSPDEKNKLAQASYNAGTGNILKAQRFCGDARLWDGINQCLHLATGDKNAHETKTYVERIARWWKQMELQ